MQSTAAQSHPLMATLAKPTSAYKLRAWSAMVGLALFVMLYIGLAAWFVFTAYRLAMGSLHTNRDFEIWGWLGALCAAFLAVFMLKAIFFVKRGGTDGHVELLPAQQPELFRFLQQLADQAGAPRPHKVFVSPSVNAAVFYDLSVLNLLFPSKKNLEVGLGLVNSLTLGEFRAVLAHEFGHFTQRAMAVGRWVYVAQQIAAHLVGRRDKLDDFLRALSRIDVRLAWIGWLLSLIVWSIRSLVDTAFQAVVLMQRALSREMEMNADLVAVSLTGSDALIHALHRLQAADNAWARAMGFVMSQKADGKLTRDLFAIQTQVIAHMGRLLNDADYGRVPQASGFKPEEHRLFKAALAQPPQMWLTHPLNHEREANAKRHYVPAAIDERSAWTVFADPQALREQITATLIGPATDGVVVEPEESLQTLNQQFDRERFKSRYRGMYFGRSVARCAADVQALVETVTAPTAHDLDRLYPETLVVEMERLRAVQTELAQLRALHSGALRPPGGVINHRGQTLRRGQLPQAIEGLEHELAEVQNHLQTHDRRCRSLHRAAALHVGSGWGEYHQGLLDVLHFADHTEDNLRDLQGVLGNTVNLATATARVSKADMARIVNDGNQLQRALAKVFAHAAHVVLDETLLQRMGVPSWVEALGELTLGPVSKENVGEWLKVVDSWVEHTAGACGALCAHALEQLLLTEAALAEQMRQGTQPSAAPAASHVATGYDTLLLGAERKRRNQLGAWARFQTANGIVPAAARLVVAGGIVGAVLGLGGTAGSASIAVYNGIARPVTVKIGTARPMVVPPFGSATQDADPRQSLQVETRTAQGQLIETFDVDLRGSFGQFVYNVAGAAPLVEWTVAYGNATPQPERALGAPRWTASAADVLFGDAPKSVRTKGGGATRAILSGLGEGSPAQQMKWLATEAEWLRMATVRARWEPLDSRYAGQWLSLAQMSSDYPTILAQRLAESPNDALLLRQQQRTARSSADPSGLALHPEPITSTPR